MSRRQIAQELECNFNTSGKTVIDPDCMEWLLSGVKEPKNTAQVLIEIFGFGKSLTLLAIIFW